MVEELLSESDPVEKMPGPDFLPGCGIDHPEVLSDADVIPYSLGVEPFNPFLADKLPVCHQTINATVSEKFDEPLHQGFPFLPVGIATFVQKFEQQRKCDTLIANAEHEDVYVGFPELPVGPVHSENHVLADRKKAENHFGYQVEVEGILGKESLEPAHVGVAFHGCGHRSRKFVKADGLDHTEGMDDKCHQLYAGEIHCFSKMLLHNREDLVNFDRVLGIFSNFHGEKSGNFSFKLLNFKDFYKYNHLKIRCLTA